MSCEEEPPPRPYRAITSEPGGGTFGTTNTRQPRRLTPLLFQGGELLDAERPCGQDARAPIKAIPVLRALFLVFPGYRVQRGFDLKGCELGMFL
jgi:hypothetical protein